jgi:hypothetical protein
MFFREKESWASPGVRRRRQGVGVRGRRQGVEVCRRRQGIGVREQPLFG